MTHPLCPQGLKFGFTCHSEAQACSPTQHTTASVSIFSWDSSLPTPSSPAPPTPSSFLCPHLPQLPPLVHRHVGPAPGITVKGSCSRLSPACCDQATLPTALPPHSLLSAGFLVHPYLVVSTTSFLSCCRYSRRRLGKSRSRVGRSLLGRRLSCFWGLRLRVRRKF